MNYLNAKLFSEYWGISERRIIKLFKDGRIDAITNKYYDRIIIDEVEIIKNTLNIELPKNKKYLLYYENISKDINSLLTGFTNSSNNTINTNGTIDKNEKSELLKTGEYYKILNYYYSQLKKEIIYFLYFQ